MARLSLSSGTFVLQEAGDGTYIWFEIFGHHFTFQGRECQINCFYLILDSSKIRGSAKSWIAYSYKHLGELAIFFLALFWIACK